MDHLMHQSRQHHLDRLDREIARMYSNFIDHFSFRRDEKVEGGQNLNVKFLKVLPSYQQKF